MKPPPPAATRVLVWVAVAAAYMVVGSLAPFVLLLGWWEAIPAVVMAVVLSERAGEWAERARSAERVASAGDAS
jgi:hypothetical protein